MDPTTRFGERAREYSEYRPSYPNGVFDALFDGLGDARRLEVADVGAGTGIATALLAQRVRRVVAIEPNERMRVRATPLPNVVWRAGTAERTGLDDTSVDIATAFQAFHWFDAAAAMLELRRVARSRIAIVQYERDESDGFTRAYAETIRPFVLDDTEALRLRAMEIFATLAGSSLRRSMIPSAQTLTEDGLLGRAASTSYVPASGPDADRLRQRLRELFAAYQRDGAVDFRLSVFVLTTPSTSPSERVC